MQLSDKAKALVEEKYKDGHKKRLEHIFGVALMEKKKKKRHNVDVEKAKVAAYMHDYSKYDEEQEFPKYDSIHLLELRDLIINEFKERYYKE